MTLMRLKSYPVRLWYKLPVAPHPVRTVCSADCQLCSQPRQNVFDAEGALSVAEESTVTSSDHTQLSPVTEAVEMIDLGDVSQSSSGAHVLPPPPRNRSFHMRGASGFGEQMIVQGAWGAGAGLSLSPRESTVTGAAADVANGGDPWFGDIGGDGADEPGSSSSSGDDSRWRCWEGEISSLMVVVTPTRSDKSKHGIVPHAHLSDGRLHLVIVRKCTRMQFFRFLLSLPRGGVDESLGFVEVKEVEAWRLEELKPAEKSVWNVDGELMQTGFMSARCHHGLVQVFGRGPEVQ
jgi:hypothetical protein